MTARYIISELLYNVHICTDVRLCINSVSLKTELVTFRKGALLSPTDRLSRRSKPGDQISHCQPAATWLSRFLPNVYIIAATKSADVRMGGSEKDEPRSINTGSLTHQTSTQRTIFKLKNIWRS